MTHWDRRELNKLVAENPDEYKKRFPEPFSAMIPEDASSSNKLATEAYVDEHGGNGSDPEAVKYTEQALTAEQKAQALANIGAASEGDVAALADQKYEGPYATDGDLPAASASTMGAIYLVGPDANDEYERKVTKLSGSTYSWVSLGTTAITLANYATKEEVTELDLEVDEKADQADLSQLEAKVTDIEGKVAVLPESVSTVGLGITVGHAWIADNNTQVGDTVTDDTSSTYQYYHSSTKVPIEPGAMLHIGTRKRINHLYHIIFVDEDGKFISGDAIGTSTADTALVYYDVTAPVGSAFLIVNCYSVDPDCTETKYLPVVSATDVENLENKMSPMGSEDPDAYPFPDVSNSGFYYNASIFTVIGSTVAADKSMTGGLSARYRVNPGDSYYLNMRRYGNVFYAIFVDQDMKFISGEFYIASGNDYKEGIVFVPDGAYYMLVNGYSQATLVKKTNFVKAAPRSEVKNIKIDAIYDIEPITMSKNPGRYEVLPTTVKGSTLSVTSGSTWVNDVIPVTPGDEFSVKFSADASKRFYIIFADADMKLVSATGYYTAIENVERTVVVPDGVSKMILQSKQPGNTVYGCSKINATTTIDRLMHPGIVEQNRDVEIRVNAACNYTKIDRAAKNFGLFVITDIHGDATRFKRHCEYISRMDCIDAGICLGDMQDDNFYNDIDWYIDNVNALKKTYLTVIGNHDAGNTAGTDKSATVDDCYTKYIQPTLARIGDNTIDKTYYMRLFDDYKIAVIVLNVFDGPDTMLDASTFAVSRTVECMSQAQVTWFIDALASIPSDYHLMLCYHYIDSPSIKTASNFTDDYYATGISPLNNAYLGVISEIVNAWISGTSLSKSYEPLRDTDYLPTISVNADFSSRGIGIFVGHLIGHIHRDYIGKITEYPNQIVIGFGFGNIGGAYNSGDTPRLDGTKSQDLDTVVAVDTANKSINLVRVGANTTYKLVDRTYFRISYGTE